MIVQLNELISIARTKELLELLVLIQYSNNYSIVFVYKDTGKVVDVNTTDNHVLDSNKGSFTIKDKFFYIRHKIATGSEFTNNDGFIVNSVNHIFAKEPRDYVEVHKPLNKFITYGHEDVIYYVTEVKATTMKVISKYNETLEVSSSVDINEWTPKENEMFVYVSKDSKLSIGVNSENTDKREMDKLLVMPYGFDVDAYTSYLNSLKGDNND